MQRDSHFHDVKFSTSDGFRMSKSSILAYLGIMGVHGEVHAAPGGEAEAGHGVDCLVASDPEPAAAPELVPGPLGPSDQLQAGDRDKARHQQLRQPEVSGSAMMDVKPARHIQVRSTAKPGSF